MENFKLCSASQKPKYSADPESLARIEHFLLTPFKTHRTALEQLKICNQLRRFSKSDNRNFEDAFCSVSDPSSMSRYLKRLSQPKELAEAPILELACFIYSQVLLCANENMKSAPVATVLFAEGVNLAQKLMFDTDISPPSLSKLLGLPVKALYSREMFLMRKIYDYQFRIDAEEFYRFRQYLVGLSKKTI